MRRAFSTHNRTGLIMTAAELRAFIAQEFRYPTDRHFAYAMAFLSSCLFIGALMLPNLIGIFGYLLVAGAVLVGFVYFIRHIFRMIDEEEGRY